ncbi:MAG TPA: GntR family transcriptional regulator [Vicinamibacterales bacterium]|nr:GntR family transcriptional regulator [Vicinamibacterales bacterium]
MNRRLPSPLYHQLKAAILRDIQAGVWRPGDRLPTDDDWMVRYGVSKITVRQALRELAQMGYVRREQGRGTFVQRPPLDEGPRELTSFTAEMRTHGLAATSRVLEQGVLPAPEDVAAALHVPAESAVFRLRRLRLADGTPMGLQTAYLSMHLVPQIDLLSFDDISLYHVLADRYGLQPAAARETHRAILVGGDDAALLRVAPGAPALAAERLTSLEDGRPLEYVHSIMRGDRYRIVLDLSM